MLKIQSLMHHFYKATAVKLVGLDLKTIWTPLQEFGKTKVCGAMVELPGKRTIIGYAFDTNPRLLPIKALMEALESVAIEDSGMQVNSRSGIAARFTQHEAQEAAYQELVERDAFVLHWLGELPGKPLHSKISSKFLNLYPDVPEARHAQLVQLCSHDPEIMICMAATKSRYGCWNIGLGNAKSLDAAAKKAVGECMAGVFWHIHQGMCTYDYVKNREEPNLKKAKIMARHHAFSREKNYSDLIEYILFGYKSETTQDLYQSIAQISASKLEMCRFESLKTRSKNYFVVRAINSSLMPLIFGEEFKASAGDCAQQERCKLARSHRIHSAHASQEFLAYPFD